MTKTCRKDGTPCGCAMGYVTCAKPGGDEGKFYKCNTCPKKYREKVEREYMEYIGNYED